MKIDKDLNIEGTAGELIGRLVDALSELAEQEAGAEDLPVTGLSIALGFPWDHTRPNLDALANRVGEICEAGIEEGFMVCAARDSVTRVIWRFADGIASANSNRAYMRAQWEHLRDNPQEWRSKYVAASEQIAYQADWTDEQISEEMDRNAKNPLLDPVDADAAGTSWRIKQFWNQISEEKLSDLVIERWTWLSHRGLEN